MFAKKFIDLLDRVDVSLTYSNASKFSNIFTVFRTFSNIFEEIDRALSDIQLMRAKFIQKERQLTAQKKKIMRKLKYKQSREIALAQLKSIQLAKNAETIYKGISRENMKEVSKRIANSQEISDLIIAKRFLPKNEKNNSQAIIDKIRLFMLEDFKCKLFSFQKSFEYLSENQENSNLADFLFLEKYFRLIIRASIFNFSEFAEQTILGFANFSKNFAQTVTNKNAFWTLLDDFFQANFKIFEQYKKIVIATSLKILNDNVEIKDNGFSLESSFFNFLKNLAILFNNLFKESVLHLKEIYFTNDKILRQTNLPLKLPKFHLKFFKQIEESVIKDFEPRLANLITCPQKRKAICFYWSKIRGRLNIDGLRQTIKEVEAELLANLADELSQIIQNSEASGPANLKLISHLKLKQKLVQVLGFNDSHDIFFEANRKLIVVDESDQALFVPVDALFERFIILVSGLLKIFKQAPAVKELARERIYKVFEIMTGRIAKENLIDLSKLLQLINQIKAIEQAYKNTILQQVFNNFERNNSLFSDIKSIRGNTEERFIKFLESKLNVDATLYISKYGSTCSDFTKVKSPSDELSHFLGEIKQLLKLFDENLMANLKRQCAEKLIIIKEKIIIKELEALKRIRKIQPFLIKNEMAFLNSEFDQIINQKNE